MNSEIRNSESADRNPGKGASTSGNPTSPRKLLESRKLENIRKNFQKFTKPSVFIERLPAYAGIFTVLVGFLGLIGWVFDLRFFKSILSGYATMKPNTAICFILLGSGLWLLKDQREKPPPGRLWIGRACALIPAIIGLVTGLEYIFRSDLGIDYLFFRQSLMAENLPWPGRMSGISCIGFFLLGISLILTELSVTSRLHQAMAIFVTAISLVAFSGYVYNVSALYQIAFFNTLALNTVLTFFVLSAGILFSDRKTGITNVFKQNSLGGLLVRRLVPAVLVLPFIISWLRQKGEQLNLYEPDFGLALVATSNIILFSVLIWWSGRTLDRLDRQRREAHDEFLKEKKFSETAINSLPGIFYLFDNQGRFLLWNKNFETVTGYSEDEIADLRPADLFGAPEKPQFEKRIAEVFAEGGSSAEGHLVSKYGTQTPFFFTGNRVRFEDELCLVGMGIDITERRRVEETLRENEAKFRSVTETASDAILTIDKESKIVFANPATENIFGYPPDEIVGKPLAAIIPENYGNSHPPGISRFFETDEKNISRQAIQLPGRHKDGRKIPLELSFSQHGAGGRNLLTSIIRDISKRQKTEEELRESEKRYRHLFENNPFPMWVYDLETLRFLAVNGAAQLQYGYSEKEFLSMTIRDIRPEEEIPRLLENVRETEKRLDRSGPWDHRKRDGTLIQVEISSHEMAFDGRKTRLVLANDITEQIKAQELLRAKTKQIEDILERINDGFITLDNDFNYTYVNRKIGEMVGRDPDSLIGKNVWEEFPDAVGSETYKVFCRALSERQNQKNIDYYEPLDLWQENRVYSTPEGISVFIRDISEEKKAEQKITKLNEELEQKVIRRTAELEAANRELETFSYSVSHDLRAPLRAIDGFSLALLEDYSEIIDPEGRHFLNRIRKASQKMAQLIEDLLKLSRVTRREIRRTEINLSQMAREIAQSLTQDQPQRKVNFQIQEDLLATADEGLLHIVLQNLIDNAWKFTSKKEIAEISFGAVVSGKKVEYFVRDNGAGFSMKYADKLFGAFHRLHREEDFEGTGIGLATVQRIIQRHGGTIRPESKVGRGATFYFTI
ncbi:MAG: PAS domain S-box protein [Pyrinomonadaceae bacterium]